MGSLCQARIVLAFAVMGLVSSSSMAGPLNPLDPAFTPLGAFPSTAGVYTINTSAPTAPTLTEPGGAVLSGVYFQDSPGHIVAVFDFSTISLNITETITATGAVPVALLSQGGATIGGTINLNGTLGASGAGGGSVLSPGPGAGTFITAQGGGSGFGGQGGTSGIFTLTSPPTSIPAIPGGGTYGNLATSLQGGSFNLSGAGAGGGIEIGAVGGLNVLAGGLIEANGASDPVFGGGGSGGGIFLHAASINLSSGALVSANGGNGGAPGFIAGPGGGFGGGGGGGGGGRILLQYSDLADSSTPIGDLTVKGGIGLGGTAYTGGINDGNAGTITINAATVPEPGSLAMVALSAAIFLGYNEGRRRRPGRS